MAANFSSAEGICEGKNCEAITDVTYYVKEKKKLCDDCASKEECIGKARKGGPNLYCEKHDGEEIKLYCRTHNIAVCQLCAMIDHHDQSCVRQDITGVIMERRDKLNILQEMGNDKLLLCRVHGDQIHQCRKDTDTHLQALTDEGDSVIKEAIQTYRNREQEDAAKINKEIDEKNRKLQGEIQKIKDKIEKNEEEREKRLGLNCTNAEKRREPINNKQYGLKTEIQNISLRKAKKIGELENAWQDDTKTTETAIKMLETILEDDKNVVKDWNRIKTLVGDELKMPPKENGVKQITSAISGIRFVKGAGRKKYDGRINGYGGKWELIDSINVKDLFRNPTIVGCIDECNLIITERVRDSYRTHMLEINTKDTQRVITDVPSWVVSCALLGDDKIVCGKYSTGSKGNSLASVYDRQWEHINNISIPRTYDYTRVDVAAHKDGMIIAAEWGQSKIYFINQAGGKIDMKCKENIRMHGVRSSGHIIARPSPPDHRLLIIGCKGAQSEILHSGVILNACIDPMTDDLYVVTSDNEYKTCVIDRVMSGGEKRRVASFPLSIKMNSPEEREGLLISSRVLMTSSGKLIACDGDNILVFKDRFIL